MKRHLSDSEPECLDDYDECSSPDTMQISRKKRRGIIEKRRRDRINNCLVELRRLVPAAFEKQGSAKLEKAEILQMTVDHLRHLHQTRDPRGFTDPFSAYGNTRAFLDYRIMGFRECVAESARYMTSVEGLDMKDPLRVRMLNHLENFLAQRELAINAAVAASAQIGIPKLAPVSMMGPTIAIPSATVATAAPYAPLTPPRASPDNLSPPANFMGGESLPRFSVAFSTAPMISFAPPTGNVPILRAAAGNAAAAAGFRPVAAAAPITNGIITSAPVPITKTTFMFDKPTEPISPTKTSKAPFRPWATDNDS